MSLLCFATVRKFVKCGGGTAHATNTQHYYATGRMKMFSEVLCLETKSVLEINKKGIFKLESPVISPVSK